MTTYAPDHLRSALEGMLREMQERGLSVGLIPSSDFDTAMRGGCIRAVFDRNPIWFRGLLEIRPRLRSLRPVGARKKHLRAEKYVDSTIDRRHVLRALRGLLNGGTKSELADELLAIAAKWTPEGEQA